MPAMQTNMPVFRRRRCAREFVEFTGARHLHVLVRGVRTWALDRRGWERYETVVVAFDMCVRERNRWRSLVRRVQDEPRVLEHVGRNGETAEFERVHARKRPAREKRRPSSWKTSKSSKPNQSFMRIGRLFNMLGERATFRQLNTQRDKCNT